MWRDNKMTRIKLCGHLSVLRMNTFTFILAAFDAYMQLAIT